jgi:hypothetical protein
VKQEDPVRAPARSFVRVVVVVILGGFILAMTMPNILTSTRGYSLALLGVTLSPDFHVASVIPGTSAAKAGLRSGDRIDVSSLTIQQRMDVWGASFVRPGEVVQFAVVRNNAKIPMRVMTPPANTSQASTWLTVIKRCAAAVFVIVAGGLLLLRPSRMLWGFYLFALGSVGGSPIFYLPLLPGWLEFALQELVYNVYYALFFLAGLLIFVARFPGDSTDGWRAWIDRAAVPFALLYAGVLVASDVLQVVLTNVIPEPVSVAYALAIVADGAEILAVVCLFSGFIHLQADQRQRLKWVVAAVVTFALAQGYINVALFLPNEGWPVSWTNARFTSDVLNALEVVIPLAVAYAVLKHRVLDVNFVISRALVYGILTTVIVGAFAIVDWVIGRALESRQLAFAADLAVAVAFGFGLNGLHKRVDTFVDRVLFRHRHLAEVRLERISAGLPHVTSVKTVDELAVAEPADAFGLTSAAIFRRGEAGRFAREAAIGWPADTAAELHSDDPIIVNLQGERGALRLRAVRRKFDDLPSGAAMPALIIPLLVRHQLEGVALYGAHSTGEDIDPDEVRVLERLLSSASAAYDHIEAQALRRRVEELARENKRLARTVKGSVLGRGSPA